MFSELRSRSPDPGLGGVWLYEVCRTGAVTVLREFFSAEAYHAERVPKEGALILAANHQSYLDPPMVGGMAGTRHCSYLAKAPLFSFKPFGALLRAINCVPVSGDGGDAGSIREIVRRLDRGHAVVIFPEGGRTFTGAMTPLKRGILLLLKRARCPVLPVAVEGCYDAWKRNGKPRPFTSPIAVMYGQPIPYDELMKDGPEAALERLHREIDGMRRELRAMLRRQTRGEYPKPGAGDQVS